MRTPNTFIVGAPKCGTTSMVRYLAQHPCVFFSNLKEPGYWATDYPWLAKRNALTCRDEYLRLFANAAEHHQIVGEASTMYLSSEHAAGNILEFEPSARFIAMLRNPIQVAQAYHMQKLLMFHEDVPDFETAWRLQTARRTGMHLPPNCPGALMLQYGAIPQFGPQVRRLLKIVPRDSVHFIRFDDLRSDPSSTYRALLRFLHLEDDGRREFPVAGPAREHRSRILGRLFHDPPELLREPVMSLRRHLVRQRYPIVEGLKRRMFKRRPRQAIHPAFHAELVEHFTPDVRELERLLGWQLQGWLEAGSA